MKHVKKSISVLLAGTACLQSFSQNVLLPETNMFCDGDKIVKQQIVYSDLSERGCGIVWDISGAEAVNPDYTVSYMSCGEDTIIGVEHNTMYYYNLDNDTLFLTGFENGNTKMAYDRPEPVLRFPVRYGDVSRGVTGGTLEYYGREKKRVSGTYSNEADAFGSIVTPELDTLRNVIRVHSSVTYGILHTDYYRWYADGYRYPVLETVKTSFGSDTLSTAFYYPPLAQELYLAPDNANYARRVAQHITSGPPRHDMQHADTGRNLFGSYRIDCSTTGRIEVNCTLNDNADVSAGLYTSRGIRVSPPKSARLSNGTGSIGIDISGYLQGVYILHIVIGGETFKEKITIK